MKAIFISYSQAIGERVMAILNRHSVRGFTQWTETEGRGMYDGDPHYGSHAWPSKNSTILAIAEQTKVEDVLADLRVLDQQTQMQGMRAFVWNIENQL